MTDNPAQVTALVAGLIVLVLIASVGGLIIRLFLNR